MLARVMREGLLVEVNLSMDLQKLGQARSTYRATAWGNQVYQSRLRKKQLRRGVCVG